jgi:hypothetical protein
MAAGSSKPVLYYTFEAGSGTAVTDRSNAGNNLDAGFTATPSFDGTNKVRGSYSMNFCAAGTCALGNGKVTPDSNSIGDLSTFSFMNATRIWTISMWIRPEANGTQGICGNTASATSGTSLLYIASTGIRVHFGSSYLTFGTASQLSLNTWAHLLVTMHGPADDVKCYVDGVNVGSTLPAPSAIAGNTPNTWAIGNIAYGLGIWSTSLNGQIDEYSMWDTAFTDDDVATIYNSGTPYDISDGLSAAGLPSGIKDVGGVAGAGAKMVGGVSAASIKTIMGVS